MAPHKKGKAVTAGPAPVIPSISSLPLSSAQTTKAISAIVDHTASLLERARDKGDLLIGGESSNEDTVSLVVTLKRASPREKHKPILIPLPHALLDPRESPVCLFVKDPQREYKDLLAEHKIGFISKVVGVSKLRGKHAPFEARRLLQKSHSLFLADARILPLLIPLLGNAFINTKSLPIPVDLASPRPSLKAELERAIGGTTLRLSSGTCLNLKLGSATRHSKTELQANLETVVTHLAAKLPLGGWDNVQALHVKSGTSTSLPIWNASLEADVPGGRFSALPESEAKKKAEATERKDKAKAERQERKEKKEKKLAKRRSEPEAVDEAPAAKKTKRTDAQSAAKKAKADVPSTSAQPRPTLPDAELSLVDGSPVVPTPAPTKPNKKAPAAPAGSTAATVSAAPKASDAPSAGKSKETRNKGKAAPAGEAKPKKSVSSASKKVKGLSKVKA